MKILSVLSAIIAGGVGWLIGKAVGEAVMSAYRKTGDLVTAKDSVDMYYITPAVFALLFAIAAYYLTKGED